MIKTPVKLMLLLLLPLVLRGQQLTHWSQFQALNYTFNPAVTEFGEEGNFVAVDLAYRQQWSTFEDAPQTGLVGFQFTNRDLHMTLGGFLLNDQFGPTNYTQGQVQYAYQIPFDYRGDHALSIGLGVSATQFRLDGDKIKTESNNDQLLTDVLQTRVFANASIGCFYHNELSGSFANPKYLFAGLSVEQAIPSDLNFDGEGNRLANLKRELHYHAMLGTRFYYGAGYDYVEPVIWGKLALHAPVNVTTGVRMTFGEQRFWGGLAVSSAWEGYFQFGVTVLEHWQIGYANALFLANTFSASSGMSHELRISFRRWL